MNIFSKIKEAPSQPTRAAAPRLEDLEAIIDAGLTSFAQVGKALATIKAKRLFAAQYETWEDYLLNRWKITADYANRLVAAADVALELVRAGLPEPTRASHARTLATIPAEQRVEVWTDALDAAQGNPEAITAELIERAATPRRKKKARRKSPKAITLRGQGWAITITRKTVDVSVVEALAAALNQAQALTEKKAA